MAAVLYLLHAINPGVGGGWSISGTLQITNWQYHSILQFTALKFACKPPQLRERRAAGAAGRAGVEQEYRLKRPGDNRDCGLFCEIVSVSPWGLCIGRWAALPTLIIMHFGKRPPPPVGGIGLLAAAILSGRCAVRVSSRSMEPAANLTWPFMLICPVESGLWPQKGGLGRNKGGVCASIW
jgi:hypothetical protein